jgi:internalin A
MDEKLKRNLLYLAGAIFLLCITLFLVWLAPRSAPGVAPDAAEVLANPEIVHRLLKARNPGYGGQAQFAQDQELGLIGDFNGSEVSDLSPLAGIPFGGLDLRSQPITTLISLKGMPLKFLGIEDTQVSDLAPLKGMKLEKLYMNNTPVSDLGPLAGMPLVELMLADSNVKDITPLKGSPLQSLWLNNTQVRDISPLAGGELVSLTLEGTEVADLGPLSEMTSLKRLHIGGTPVSDITPLGNLRLERLIFTPGNIKKGLDAARGMKTLQEIGTTLETRMSPQQFWQQYDRNKNM